MRRMNETAIRLEVEALGDKARVIKSPLPGGEAGSVVTRVWGEDAQRESVLFLHGGSGSWLHWYRNIPAAAAEFTVYAMDLPGLGDSAMPGPSSDAEESASATLAAIRDVMSGPFHIVAFSWGCTMTAMIHAELGDKLKSVMLTGPAAVGNIPRRQQMQPMQKRSPDMSRREVLAAQRHNLATLMIHKDQDIDDLAIILQDMNTSKARFKSPQYATSSLVVDGLRGSTMPLYVIYGDHDAPAYPGLELRREIFKEIRPDVRFELVQDAGHWLQYEESDLFNERCIDWLKSN